MSSLIRCTDDLLHHKAVQASHYERLERQLLDGERCRRAALLSLRQRIADVTRRGKDVVELREENNQLAEQLAQHGLQLAALQCRRGEAQRRDAAAMEKLQDGVRSFAGHPARIVLIVHALQAQRQLQDTGRRLHRTLTSLWVVLRVRRRVATVAAHSTELLCSHAATHAVVSGALRERITRCSMVREAAQERLSRIRDMREGVVAAEQHSAERALHAAKARAAMIGVYAEALEARRDAAMAAVSAVSVDIDRGHERVSAAQQVLQDRAAAVAEAQRAVAVEGAAHVDAVALMDARHRRLMDDISSGADEASMADAHATATQQVLCDVQRRREALVRRLCATACLALLCERHVHRLARRRAAQDAERARTEATVALLRTQHEEHLSRRRAARVAAAHLAARDGLCAAEAQCRDAAVGLEADEWRLLYAQLVRDACRARAAGAAAKAVCSAHAPPRDGTCATDNAERRPPPVRKRGRAERLPHATPTCRGRRQLAATEAVDSLTCVAASPGSTSNNIVAVSGLPRPTSDGDEQEEEASERPPHRRHGTAAPAVSKSSAPLLSPPSIITAASPLAPRPTYRLTSVRPAADKKRPPTATPRGVAADRSARDAPARRAVVVRASGTHPHPGAARDEWAAAYDSGSDAASEVRLLSPSPPPRFPGERHLPTTAPPHLLRRAPHRSKDECTAAAATATRAAPRSALAVALAARAPRSTDRSSQSHVTHFSSHFTGNTAGLPTAGVAMRPPLATATSSQPSSPSVLLQRPRDSKTAPRRRAPHLTSGATDHGEDIFGDLFS
ncbi:hypothetical protein NESM_000227600 [Novymonas esmeraldas]|uniref:Uncharacterized protein n=1 Tax=Novymonas esmeraldas TaxID=1808958 RepID=A0AAW0F9Y9_9TRYP